MRCYFDTRILITCFALFMTVGSLKAQTIEVPGDHATIQAAIDAATTDSTILITDSATYAGPTINLDKRLRIEAAPGENPTITNDGALDAGALINFADPGAASGTKIGSIDGGKINLVLTTTAPGYDASGFTYIFPRLTGGFDGLTSLTLENLFVTQDNGGNLENSGRLVLVRDDGASTRTFTYSHIEVNDNGDKASETLRQNNAFGYHNVDNCYMHNYSGTGYPLYSRFGVTFNITNSAFDNSGSTAQTFVIFTPSGDGRHPTINIDGSILISGTGPVFFRRTATGFLTLTNSVFITNGGEIYDNFGTNDQPDFIDADHCDFIVFNGEEEDIAIFNPEDDTTNDISITNSNIIGVGSTPTGSTVPAVNIDATQGGTVVLDHNNVYAPGWVGGLYHSSLTPTDSLSLDPDYSGELLFGDARYDNATLKTADSTGGAIGTDASFEHLMPQPPPPPNPAAHWTLY